MYDLDYLADFYGTSCTNTSKWLVLFFVTRENKALEMKHVLTVRVIENFSSLGIRKTENYDNYEMNSYESTKLNTSFTNEIR